MLENQQTAKKSTKYNDSDNKKPEYIYKSLILQRSIAAVCAREIKTAVAREIERLSGRGFKDSYVEILFMLNV